MFDTSDEAILSKFPFNQPREGQLETIRFVLNTFNSGKKYAIVEAPCGAGKSAIAMAVSGYFNNSYYLTIQKILQDQLIEEFGENGKYGNAMVELKGRGSYPCPYFRLNADKMLRSHMITSKLHREYLTNYYNCAEGHCKVKGKVSHEECLSDKAGAGQCPYFKQKAKAMAAKICLMNFAGFLSHMAFSDASPQATSAGFGTRELLILDEAHNIETQLLSFITVTILESDLNDDDSLGHLKLPSFDTAEEYAAWMMENDVQLRIAARMAKAQYANDLRAVDELKSLQSKITWFINEMTEEGHDPWVVDNELDGDKRVVFRPVYVRKHAQKYLFNKADHVLLLSATILNVPVMTRSLGLKRDEVAAKRLGSRFPVANRPIYYKPAVKVTGGASQIDTWGPPLVKAVNEICKKHNGVKGIIHTHNNAIMNLLKEECSRDVSGRMLLQTEFNNDKRKMMEAHAAGKNTILVAPAMHEGVDLKDDLSRFQIICKMPFPNFYEDKQLAARKEDDAAFYDWLVALKLVQSVGRSVRSEQDWADTYIIDQSFLWWYRGNEAMLPAWFKEAVIL